MICRLKSSCLSVFAVLLVCGALSPSAALAGAVHQEFDLPQPPFFIDCLGEEIEGLLHIRNVTHFRTSANGGFHATSNGTQMGVIEGLSSGSTWTLRGVGNFSGSTQGDQLTITAVSNLVGVSPGNPTLLATYREILTIDANGVLRVYHFIDTIRCQGNPN